MDTHVQCPRCGYDLRGHLDLHPGPSGSHDAEGTCVECGLAFRWADVRDPGRVLPPWCVEQDALGRLRLRQVVETAVRSLHPLGFWTRLRMTGRHRPGRIAAYLLIVVAFLYVPFALGLGEAARMEWRWMSTSPGITTAVTQERAWWHAVSRPLSSRSAGVYATPVRAFAATPPLQLARVLVTWLGPMLTLGLLAHLATACAFAALPVSRRRAKVRALHIGRVTAYGLVWVVPFVAVGIWAWAVESIQVAGATVLLIPVVLAAWWWSATRRYLRMSQPELVAASMVAIGVLSALAFGGVVWIL